MTDDAVPRALVEVLDGVTVVATVRVDGHAPPLFVVDVCARIELAARVLGWRVRVRCPGGDVCDARDVCGLPPVPEP